MAADKFTYKQIPECIAALFTPIAAHHVLHVRAEAVRQRWRTKSLLPLKSPVVGGG